MPKQLRGLTPPFLFPFPLHHDEGRPYLVLVRNVLRPTERASAFPLHHDRGRRAIVLVRNVLRGELFPTGVVSDESQEKSYPQKRFYLLEYKIKWD